MKIRVEVKINCILQTVLDYISNGEKLHEWNSAVKQVEINSRKDDNTTIFSIVRKLPSQIVENLLEVTVNKSVNTINMKTTSGYIPFIYHIKLVPFRGTTNVILNADLNKNDIITLLGPQLKKVPKIILKKMMFKEVNADLYSLKIILEKICTEKVDKGVI
ncbi:MAG: hypothetical protein EU530_01215 [Promethearchaeota archaeon]|nr:MAG: hypothetical protein EU530_01215 [Candidatus Lokiarchaeota archaeon]